MAVEASLLLPIFIFFFLHLISVLQFLSCYGRIEAALHQTGRKLSVYAYLSGAGQDGAESPENIAAETVAAWFKTQYVKEEVQRLAGTEYLERSPIVGKAAGIRYVYSRIPGEDECIDLVAQYRVKPMFALPGVMELRLVNRCRMRTWTGYQVQAGEGENGGLIVYITENGSVYHLSAGCTHLRLSVRRTGKAAVAALRNTNGGKYYLCEICGRQTIQDGRCYITSQGDRYHYSLSCSGLKRSVRAVPLQEVDNMPVCSRCG